MQSNLPRIGKPGHVASGCVMVALGGVGLNQFWQDFGVVGRGLIPFAVIAGGMVMIGAGIRSLRERRGLSPSIDALTPIIVTVSGLVMAAAAASGIEIDFMEEWHPGRVAGYMALGLVSGIVGGMLGLGGGVVHLSGMTLLFGFPFGFARGATLINNVFINAAAALRYGRRGLLSWDIVAVLLPASLAAVVGGSLLQAGFEEALMRRIFAVFILVVTVAIIFDTVRNISGDATTQDGRASPARHLFTGGLAGFLCGVLGISGGIVAVPGQTMLSSVPLRNAIANSTVVTSISSALGSLMLVLVGGAADFGGAEMATIALLFIPGNLIGGHFGALWMERLPVVAVRGFFVTALIAIAVRSWGWI